jgi:hypothetical protein
VADLSGSLFLEKLIPGFGSNLPLHSFAWLVGAAGNFLEGLVKGEVVTD